MPGIFLVYAQADQNTARQVGQMLGTVSWVQLCNCERKRSCTNG